MKNINNNDLKSIINHIGKEAFVSIFYPEIKANPDITSCEIAQKHPRMKYTDKSWDSRTRRSKRLFRDGLEKEALRYIIESSKKIDAKIIKQAELYKMSE